MILIRYYLERLSLVKDNLIIIRVTTHELDSKDDPGNAVIQIKDQEGWYRVNSLLLY